MAHHECMLSLLHWVKETFNFKTVWTSPFLAWANTKGTNSVGDGKGFLVSRLGAFSLASLVSFCIVLFLKKWWGLSGKTPCGY
jgi:hypothetical protein